MKRKTLISLLVLAMLLTASCGSTGTPSDTASGGGTSTDTSAAPAEEVYPYDISDLQEYEFTILNCEDTLWQGTYHVIDYDDMTGESVSDALYERARETENTLNMKFTYVKKGILDLYKEISTVVLAGEDAYDAVYTPLKFVGSMPLTGAYGLNLYDIDTLHLNDEWWNQSFIDAATLMDDKLYTSIDYVNMMGYAYSNVLYVNKDMLENHDLDTPYDTIRSGKWTYDEMNKYITAVVNLNGDDSFEASNDGTCIYGFAVQHEEGTMSMLNGSGEFFISLDKDGVPQLSTDVTRLSDAYDKLTTILSADGACVMKNTPELQGQTIFRDGRALFYQGALGLSSTEFRNFDFEYGVIPLPKLDEKQENYYTMVSEYTLSLVIPKTAAKPERSGMVIDYMAYLGKKDVIPELQTALCYKGMRDDDSIEMFETILNTVSLDVGYMFNWTASLTKSLSGSMIKGESTFASTYDSTKSTILESINKTLENFAQE